MNEVELVLRPAKVLKILWEDRFPQQLRAFDYVLWHFMLHYGVLGSSYFAVQG